MSQLLSNELLRYLNETMFEGTANERVVAQTVWRLLSESQASDGWQLVPTKVDNNMIDAANSVPDGFAGSPPPLQWVWDAVLAAAPGAPLR